MNVKKSLSFILILSIVLGIVFSLPVFAASEKTGNIKKTSGTAKVTTNARMFSAPGTGGTHSFRTSEYLITVPADTIVTFDYTEDDADGDSWYHITSGAAKTGFIYSGFLKIQKEDTPETPASNTDTSDVSTSTPNYVYNANFEQQLLYFPTEYYTALRNLHSKYPNWIFVPYYTKTTLLKAVNQQYSSADVKKTKKYISLGNTILSYFDSRAKNKDGTYIQPEPGWTYASKKCIADFMNPQNLLTEEKIFSMMSLSRSSETVSSLRAIVKDTFLAGGYGGNKDAYINDIVEASKKSGVSSYAIAALIIVEQGRKGESPLISGTYTGYKGYYNFWNFGAYGKTKAEIYKNGLETAKKEGWNSRKLAIIGGAKKFAGDYINKGQDTYYLMDFNVTGDATHQYAANVQDAANKGKILANAFDTDTTDKLLTFNPKSTLTFKIPVYTDYYSNPFPDVSVGMWYTEAIKFVKEEGIFKGFTDGFFRPENSITRQDFVVALARTSGEKLSSYSTKTVKLKDVNKNTYYYNAVSWAYNNNIIKGYSNGYFGIGDDITREQVITIFYRYVKNHLKKDVSLPSDTSKITKKYADYSEVSGYASNAVIWALNSGLINGKSSKYIAPKDTCTRAEIAKIFFNAISKELITTE